MNRVTLLILSRWAIFSLWTTLLLIPVSAMADSLWTGDDWLEMSTSIARIADTVVDPGVRLDSFPDSTRPVYVIYYVDTVGWKDSTCRQPVPIKCPDGMIGCLVLHYGTLSWSCRAPILKTVIVARLSFEGGVLWPVDADPKTFGKWRVRKE